MRPWTLISRRTALSLGPFRIREDRLRSPRTGAETPFYVLECDDWVNVVALTDDDRLVLVRQYRAGREHETLEIPGGVVEPGEAPLDAAVRELREETGHAAETVVPLGTVEPNPAIQANACHTFLALGCRRVGALRPDDGEDLEVELLPLSELDDALRGGRIRHALAVAALHLFDLHMKNS